MSKIDKAVNEIMDVIKPPTPTPIITYGLPIVPAMHGAKNPSPMLRAAQNVADGREPGATIECHTNARAKSISANLSKQVRDRRLGVQIAMRGSRVYITTDKAVSKR